MGLAGLTGLIDALKEQIGALPPETNEENITLNDVLSLSIEKTMLEIKTGANPKDFHDLVIINFIIDSDDYGFKAKEIKEYVITIKDAQTKNNTIRKTV